MVIEVGPVHQTGHHTMRFTMPNLSTRDDSSLIQFRLKVPVDVRERAKGRVLFVALPAVGDDDALTVAAKVGDCIKFSLRIRDPGAAKVRHGAALSSAHKLFAGIRNGPKPLSLRQIVAPSGDVFRLFMDEAGDDPGSADNRQAVKAFNRAVKEGRIVTPRRSSRTRSRPTNAKSPGTCSAMISRPVWTSAPAGHRRCVHPSGP